MLSNVLGNAVLSTIVAGTLLTTAPEAEEPLVNKLEYKSPYVVAEEFKKSTEQLTKEVRKHEREVREKEQRLTEREAYIKQLEQQLEAQRVEEAKKKAELEAKKKREEQEKLEKEQAQKKNQASQPKSDAQPSVSKELTPAKQVENKGSSVGTFNATYYGMDCNGCSGRTASGFNTKGRTHYNGMRILAADTSILPLGTIVQVQGSAIGSFTGIVMDRGGAIKGKRLDILVGSEAESYSLGRQNVNVNVVSYGDNKYRKID